MHLESRCYSSSAINKQPDTGARVVDEGTPTSSASVNRTWLRAQKRDKAAGGGIFSFLQRFRVVNNKNDPIGIADSRFSLGSPQSSRYSLASAGAASGRRWESIESVISSATATSFAFIPPHQLRHYKPTFGNGTLGPDNHRSRIPNDNDKHRLPHSRCRLASDNNRPAAPNANDIKQIKRLNRNSTGNIDTFFVPQSAATAHTSHEKSASVSQNVPYKRTRCYKPGKRKAPQPPRASTNSNYEEYQHRDNWNIVASNDTQNATAVVRRYKNHDEDEDELDPTRVVNLKRPYRKKKKRRAPLPPNTMNQEDHSRDNDHDDATNSTDEPVAYCNDSLKLEKGILKANKHSVEVLSNAESVKSVSQTAAVSPKPWYKRSCVRVTTNNFGIREKRNSCRRDNIDQWMLESGIARFRRVNDDVFKRHSHISVLANISELDRQASEILEKQRKQQREAVDSAEAKFYSDLLQNERLEHRERIPFGEHTSNAKKNKDLISILNNLTNVTKMTVHSAFVSKHSTRESTNEDAIFASTSNKMVSSKQQSSSIAQNLLTNNKSKKPSKIGEIFEKPQRKEIRKKEDRKSTLKTSLSCELNDIKTTQKDKASSSPLTIQKSSSDNSKHTPNNIHGVGSNDQESQPRPGPVQKPFSCWPCPQCNSENPSWKFICETCKKWRPYSVSNRIVDQSLVILEDNASKKLHAENTTSSSTPQIPQTAITSVSTTKAAENTEAKSVDVKPDVRRTSGRGFPQDHASSARISVNSNEATTKFQAHSSSWAKSTQTNNLNSTQTKEQIDRTFQYYTDYDRKVLCDILKELKNSLTLTKHESIADSTAKINEQKIINKIDSPSTNQLSSTAVVSTSTSTSTVITTTTITNQANTSTSAATSSNLSAQHEDVHTDEGILRLSQTQRLAQQQHSDINENKNVPALAINRLLKKLQTAIANGQHHEAANIARELARLKVSCHMTRRTNLNRASSSNSNQENTAPSTSNAINAFAVSVYIKEKDHCRGPIPLQIHNTTTLKQLKMKLRDEFKIPSQRQRWTSDKVILDDESTILFDKGIDKAGVPLYVDLIENENVTDHRQLAEIPIKNDEALLKHVNVGDIEANITNVQHDTHKKTDAVINLQSATNELDHTDDQNDSDGENEMNINDAVDHHVDHIQQTVPIDTNATENEPQPIKEVVINPVADNQTTDSPTLTHTGWQCALCTLLNETHVKFCAACGERYVQINDKDTNKPEENVINDTPPVNHYAPWRNVNREPKNDDHKQKDLKRLDSYQELIDLEKSDLITNKERFECNICFLECDKNEGVVLRDCLHTFCKDCLKQTVQFSTEAQVKCPFGSASYSCDSVLQEREIKALVDADTYEKHLARSLSEAQNKIKNAFHCKTPNCIGWCIYEDNVNEFHCPVCRKTNCLTCQVIHGGLNCKQYQEMTKKESENNADTSKTRNMLEEMVEKGEAMVCPTCDIILMKKWGCDWLRCSMCKTEICWVTRGPRWGPAGKGDTSAGCRCGVNGVKCHPKCNYCH